MGHAMFTMNGGWDYGWCYPFYSEYNDHVPILLVQAKLIRWVLEDDSPLGRRVGTEQNCCNHIDSVACLG